MTTLIADYELVRPLGEATNGELFLARAPERLSLGESEVAVKVLATVASDREFRRFARELQALASVQHPNVVPLLDAGHHQGRLWYASPYYPGGRLSDHVGASWAPAVVADAARGAHALHDGGIIHRDITPRTIFLAAADGGPRGVLGDLGLADVLRPGMTSTGLGPIGGLEYADPAVLAGGRAGRSSDIWSLGATLHRVVTGRSIRPGLPDRDVVAAIKHALGTSPVIDPGCPDAVRDVVARCLAPDPSDRYADAAALADALVALERAP